MPRNNQCHNQGTEKGKGKNKRPILGSLNPGSHDDDSRTALKQLFQRDIEETVAALQQGTAGSEWEGEGCGGGGGASGEDDDQLPRQLEMEFDIDTEEGGEGVGDCGTETSIAAEEWQMNRGGDYSTTSHLLTTTPGKHKVCIPN